LFIKKEISNTQKGAIKYQITPWLLKIFRR
jgi:hypothetical protein